MPILNDLSKKLSEVAQTTVQVSKELAGSAKATLAISAEEREIEKAYRALGQWYYSTKGENPEEAAEFIETVDTSLRKIREIRQEAEAAKTAASQPVPMIACPACGNTVYVSEDDLDAGEAICPSCNVAFEVALADEDDDEAPEEPDDGPARYEVTCPACGATSVVDEEALLDGEPVCPACGKPLDFEVTEE